MGSELCIRDRSSNTSSVDRPDASAMSMSLLAIKRGWIVERSLRNPNCVFEICLSIFEARRFWMIDARSLYRVLRSEIGR